LVTIVNLRQLETFVCVADAGSFARALARLHLTQPAASRQILALEADLGVSLFDRVGRGLRLTAAGEDLLRQSREILGQADALRQRARAVRSGDAGALRIGASPQMIENSLAGFVQSYRRNLPDVDVRLIEDGGAKLPDRLARGEVDLAIMPVGDDRFDGRLLYPMHTFAVVPKNHRWRHLTVLDVTELANARLMVGTGFASRVLLDAACQVAHVRPQVVLESAAPHTLLALVRTGFGVAVLPSAASIPDKDLRFLPLVYRNASIGRWVMIAWNPQRFLAPYARRFADELAENLRREFPARDLIRRAPALPRPDPFR
jgi:LysR family cyn operon transcriptional activator